MQGPAPNSSRAASWLGSSRQATKSNGRRLTRVMGKGGRWGQETVEMDGCRLKKFLQSNAYIHRWNAKIYIHRSNVFFYYFFLRFIDAVTNRHITPLPEQSRTYSHQRFPLPRQRMPPKSPERPSRVREVVKRIRAGQMRNHSISFYGRKTRRVTSVFRIMSEKDTIHCTHYNDAGGQVGSGAWLPPEILLDGENEQFLDDMKVYNGSGLILTDNEILEQRNEDKVCTQLSMKERESNLAEALNISVDTFQGLVQHIFECMHANRIREREVLMTYCARSVQKTIRESIRHNKGGRILKDANVPNVPVTNA